MTKPVHQDQFEDRAMPETETDLLFDEFEDSGGNPQQNLVQRRSLFDRSEWFRNLTLSGKIQTVFGTFFGIIFAITLILGLGLAQTYSRSMIIVQNNSAMLEAVELRTVAGDIRYNTARYIFESEPAILDRQREAVERAIGHLDAVEAIAADDLRPFLPAVARLRADVEAYDRTFDQVRLEREQNGRSARAIELAYAISEMGDGLIRDTRKLTDDLAKVRQAALDATTSFFLSVVALSVVLVAFASVVLFLGLRYLSRDYSHSITEITDGMSRLASGDRRFSVQGHERKDEIGKMAKALDQFKSANRKLEEWARERSDRAEAEIELQQERQREREEHQAHKAKLIEELAAQFERTVGEVVRGVAKASSELQSTASKMADTAERSSERTDEVADDMRQANSGATAAAAASDEFAMSIGEISRQASSSSELARVANDATHQADTTISELSASAEQVGEIVELIQSIAQRTNLLALNASIEAARGGEAGRGFAVVASEVKELAMQTSRATEQVAEQIQAMQDTTGASVGALRSIAAQVSELESTSISIASAVDQQSVAGQDLAHSIDLAARGTEKVAEHLDDVRALSLSTGAAASQVVESANQLEQQAATLSDQAAAFLQRVRAG